MKSFINPCLIFASAMILIPAAMGYQMKAQTIIIDSTFTEDGIIYPFSQNDTIYGLSISGSLELFSDTSLVRIILSDQDGNEWMVYELYSLILSCDSIEFSNVADETKYLQVNSPFSIEVQIIEAEVIIDSLLLQDECSENLESNQLAFKEALEEGKVDSMNYSIEQEQMIWFADRNPTSDQSYSAKTSMFGQKYNLIGMDYYSGGIFDPYPFLPKEEDNSDLVSEFDWRKKHDANDTNSLYFDGDMDSDYMPCNQQYHYFYEHGNGWMTKIKDQDPGNPGNNCLEECKNCCYIYGPVAVMEAVTNLYFNYHYDLDLSEQYALDCAIGTSCSGGAPLPIFIVAEGDGIMDDDSSPWQFQKQTCDENLPFMYRFQMENHHGESNPTTEEIKEIVLSRGPISVTLDFSLNPLNHVVALLGYGVLECGDTIHDELGNIIIVGNNYAGSLYWICKNSWGPLYGDDGYFYFINNSASEEYYPIEGYICIEFDSPNPINIIENNPFMAYERHCNDFDNDGYVNWGLGDIPQGICNSPCAQTEDWNDNNRRIGPCNENFIGQPIAPQMEVHLFKLLPALDIPIENNSIISFSDNELTNGILTLKIVNPGDALLHFENSQDTLPVSILQGSESFAIIQPDPEVCMGQEVIFEIRFTGSDFDMGVFRMNVETMDKDVLPDLEFALVYNGCLTSAGSDTITGNTIWYAPYLGVHKDIFISPQASLTLKGKVAFSPESDIFVDRGGKLSIDGGHLTSLCDELWNGIDVWGDARQIQVNTYQGMVEVINGGTIEFADTAISTAKYNGIYTIPSGGIVICKDAVFKDNYVGVNFAPYVNPLGAYIPNLSRFSRTDFLITDDYYNLDNLIRTAPRCGMNMDGVHGINIKGCNFTNASLAEKRSRGSGIINMNAGYYVTGICEEDNQNPCTHYLPCRFEGWDYGIKSLNDWSLNTITVDSADFSDNYRGIFMSLTSDATIIKNRFVLNADDAYFSNGDTLIGIYTEHCNRYQIEENKFTGFDPGTYKLIGMHILNSGPEFNEIYSDSLLNLTYGIIAAGENKNKDGTDGLCIKCNDFVECEMDIYITPDGGNDPDLSGIATYQGLPGNLAPPGTNPNSMGAGNTFTSDGYPLLDYNYYNSPDLDLLYYTHQPNTEHSKLRPFPYNNIEPFEDGFVRYSKDTSCPSHLNQGEIQLQIEKILLASQNNEITNYQDTLSQYVDGGNTQGLDFEIQTSFPEDAIPLRQQLLDESPYLSDTIIKSAIAKENVLTNAMIRDVLVSNPQASKTPSVLNKLDDRVDPMPDYMMAEIMNGINNLGGKEVLERSLSNHFNEKGKSFSKVLRFYKNDTLNSFSSDSLDALYENVNSLNSDYQLVFYKLFEEDTLEALNILNNVPGNYTLSVEQQSTLALYQELVNVLIQLQIDSTNIDSLIYTGLVGIANQGLEIPGIFARNLILNSDFNIFREPVYLPSNLKKTPIWAENHDSLNSKEFYLKVFPIPSGSFIIIEYHVPDFARTVLIKIYDVNGRILIKLTLDNKQDQRIVDTKILPRGTYFVTLFTNDNVIETKKISIIK